MTEKSKFIDRRRARRHCYRYDLCYKGNERGLEGKMCFIADESSREIWKQIRTGKAKFSMDSLVLLYALYYFCYSYCYCYCRCHCSCTKKNKEQKKQERTKNKEQRKKKRETKIAIFLSTPLSYFPFSLIIPISTILTLSFILSFSLSLSL